MAAHASPEQSHARFGDIRLLLAGAQKRRSLTIALIFFLSYFCMTMVLSWLPALVTRAGFGNGVSGTSLSAWSLAGMAGVAVSGLGMMRLSAPRVVGFALPTSALVLGLIALGFPQSVASASLGPFFVLMALGGFMMNATMSSIYAYAVLMFPAVLRGRGMGFSVTSGRVGAISGSLAGVHLMERTSPNGYFLTIAALMLFTTLVYLSARGCAADDE